MSANLSTRQISRPKNFLSCETYIWEAEKCYVLRYLSSYLSDKSDDNSKGKYIGHADVIITVV